MNYSNVYHKLVLRAQNRLLENVYVERHHIIPLSMNGADIPLNIVQLTAKEHFVAHHLLWKIHRNREMTKAFMLMCNTKRNGIKYKITAKGYQILKEEFIKAQSEAIKSRPGNNLGKTLTQEWRDNISKSLIGNTRSKGKPSSFKGKKHTNKAKQQISEKLTGNSNHSIPHSEETKKMMSENRRGKKKIPWTEERKAARRKLLAEKFSQRKSP